MSFNGVGLREAFEAQGELGFSYRAYATNDGVADVLKDNYFADMCRRFRLGDMILVGTRPRPPGSPWRSATGETRRVLLIVTAVDPGGRVGVRLVQDYGATEDPPTGTGGSEAPAAVAPQVSRKRGGRPTKAASVGGSQTNSR